MKSWCTRHRHKQPCRPILSVVDEKSKVWIPWKSKSCQDSLVPSGNARHSKDGNRKRQSHTGWSDGTDGTVRVIGKENGIACVNGDARHVAQQGIRHALAVEVSSLSRLSSNANELRRRQLARVETPYRVSFETRDDEAPLGVNSETKRITERIIRVVRSYTIAEDSTDLQRSRIE